MGHLANAAGLIDHLAFEHHGEVWLQWDSNDALFPPALVETLFDAYCQLINQLCDDESARQSRLQI